MPVLFRPWLSRPQLCRHSLDHQRRIGGKLLSLVVRPQPPWPLRLEFNCSARRRSGRYTRDYLVCRAVRHNGCRSCHSRCVRSQASRLYVDCTCSDALRRSDGDRAPCCCLVVRATATTRSTVIHRPIRPLGPFLEILMHLRNGRSLCSLRPMSRPPPRPAEPEVSPSMESTTIPSRQGSAHTLANFAIALAVSQPTRVVTAFPHYPSWSVPKSYPRRWRVRETVDGVDVCGIRTRLPKQPTATQPRRSTQPARARGADRPRASRIARRWRIAGLGPGIAALVHGRLRRRAVVIVVQDLVAEGLAQSGMPSNPLLLQLARFVEHAVLHAATA